MNPSLRLRAVTAAFALTGVTIVTFSSATSSVAATRGTPAGSTQTPAPTPAAPNCGGEVATNSDGTAMTCTFDDEFSAATGDANALDTTKWVPQQTANSGYTTGAWPSLACYVNSPNNISVSNGYLNLTVRREAVAFACPDGWFSFPTQYTAGMVSTYGLFNQTYGRFEVSAKLPTSTIQGLQETLWLYPTNMTKYGAWPGSGEIDLAEFYSQYSNLDVPYIHYNYDASTTNAATKTNVVTAYNCPINYGQFNTYAAQWKPGTITLQVNGATCLVDNYVANGGLTGAQPFDQPFFMALTSALGVGSNAPGAATQFPATTQIDYVRSWK